MQLARTMALLSLVAALPLVPAKANELQGCKAFNGVFITWETERGARRASDGAIAFSYAARRRAVQLPDNNPAATTRVPLGIAWGPQLDRAALDRATEVLCYGN